MMETGLLLGAALVLRAAGAALRGHDTGRLRAVPGWLLCTTALWVAAGAIGAWSPLWPALLIGLLSALAGRHAGRMALRTGADVVTVGLLGVLSIPPLGFGVIVVAALVSAAAGALIDVPFQRARRPVRTGVVLLPILIAAGLMLLRPGLGRDLWSYRRSILHVGLMTSCDGERVRLKTGAVAWLDRPSGEGPFPGALCFHGAHRRGARQLAAQVLRRALVHAGFVTLTVDHPGFGETPIPGLNEDLAAWDPLPSNQAALAALQSMPDIDGVLVIGHSMGSSSTLQLMRAGPSFQGAVLFGAGLQETSERDDYWYERFHEDRRMRQPLAREKVGDIRARFYDRRNLVAAMTPEHPPLLFVRFEEDHGTVLASRDSLYAMIPGQKETWDFRGATHYFSASRLLAVMIGDTRVARRLGSRMRDYHADLTQRRARS